MSNNIFEIRDLKVFEISGVRNPANKKKFTLTKSWDNCDEVQLFEDISIHAFISSTVVNLGYILKDSIISILEENNIDMKEQLLAESIEQFKDTIINLKFEKSSEINLKKDYKSFTELLERDKQSKEVVNVVNAVVDSIVSILNSQLSGQEKRDLFYKTIEQFKIKIIGMVNSNFETGKNISINSINTGLSLPIEADLNVFTEDDFQGYCSICGYGNNLSLYKDKENKCKFCYN